MRSAVGGLLLLVAATLALQLTVGRDNDFGFACFILFCLGVLGLAGIGVKTLLERSRSAGD